MFWAGGQGGAGVKGSGVEGAVGGGRGSGVKGAGSGGRWGGDNINYLLKIINENKGFHFLRNWVILSASDVWQIPFLTFISLGLEISFLCLSLSLSPSLSLSHMKREVGRYVIEESNYNN